MGVSQSLKKPRSQQQAQSLDPPPPPPPSRRKFYPKHIWFSDSYTRTYAIGGFWKTTNTCLHQSILKISRNPISWHFLCKLAPTSPPSHLYTHYTATMPTNLYPISWTFSFLCGRYRPVYVSRRDCPCRQRMAEILQHRIGRLQGSLYNAVTSFVTRYFYELYFLLKQ